MRDRDLELLENMREFGERAIRLLAGRDLPAFLRDESALYAVRYSVQVIGEAAGELSPETLDLMPLVPWRDIIAMRHRLTHGYAKVSDAVVRDTVILDLPALVNEVKRVLASRG